MKAAGSCCGGSSQRRCKLEDDTTLRKLARCLALQLIGGSRHGARSSGVAATQRRAEHSRAGSEDSGDGAFLRVWWSRGITSCGTFVAR
jgi:hypothetical protein